MVDEVMNPEAGSAANRRSSYISAVAFNAVLLYVLNRLPGWNMPLITGAYREVLWALNLSLAVQIAGNLLLIFHHPPLLHHQTNVIFNAVSAVAVYAFYRTFPFDFSRIPFGWFDTVFRVLLIFTLIATIGSGIVHLLRMMRLLAFPRRVY